MQTRPFKHPLATHNAMDVLGWRRNGSPIYAIAGGSSEGEGGFGSDAGTEGGSEGSGDAGKPDGATTGSNGNDSSTRSGSGGGKPEKGDNTDWKAHAREWEKRAKDNAAATKTAVAQAAEEGKATAMQEVAKALGLVKDDGPPDPAKLVEQIAAKDTTITDLNGQLRGKDIELAVWAHADKLGAKAGALLDSRSFLKAVASLDPADKAFTGALDDAIKTALKDNPTYATQTAGRSGGDQGGSSRERTAEKRTTSIGQALRRTYNT